MNLVYFFSKQINKYNQEQKCGFCWDFSAPLTETAINIQQLRQDKECCLQVMFTQNEGIAFQSQINYDSRTNLKREHFYNENFNLYFLTADVLGKNNFNEIDGHATDESKSQILMKIKQCIALLELDFCEFLNTDYSVIRWEGRQLLNYQNNNYTGYKVSVTIRRRI